MAEDNKKIESEEEMKKRLKEEIMAELMVELEEEKSNSKSESKNDKSDSKEKEEIGEETATNKKEDEESKIKISFEGYNDKGLKEVNEINRKDRTRTEKKELKKFNLPKAPDDSETGSLNLVVILLALIGMAVLIIFLPNIYKFFQKETPSSYVDPNDDDGNKVEELEKITVSSSILSEFTYPIMRNNKYAKTTYYTKDSITMSEFSNNDILYNAFIYIYKGNVADYKGKYSGEYCGTDTTKKTFNAKYIDARIANLFSKNTEYKHATFTVPINNTTTEYIGTWQYDVKNNRYIYYGNCSTDANPKTMAYYDLKVAYEAKGLEKNTVIEVSYYMGFATVNPTTKAYNIYSDTGLSTALLSGTLTTTNHEKELEQLLTTYIETNKNLSKYKYTFSNNNCSYKDYCFEKGEWIE